MDACGAFKRLGPEDVSIMYLSGVGLPIIKQDVFHKGRYGTTSNMHLGV